MKPKFDCVYLGDKMETNMKKNDYITKGYLDKSFERFEKRFEKKIDKKFDQHNKAILEAVSSGFEDARKERNRIETKFDEKFNKIMTTMDSFLKRMTDFDVEFTIVKAELSKIKKVFKNKFGIEISLMD
jgi:YesN/AraC family two-component response regulator